MKKLFLTLSSCAVFGLGFMFTGCDWSSGGSDFNTSRGAADINISGFYRGNLGGSFAVAEKEGGAVTSFVIQQSGNKVEVTDSNGQKYFGIVGSPSAVQTSGNFIPAGATVSTFQISWKGTDGTAGIEIEFTGVIDVVATLNISQSIEVTSPNTGGSPGAEVNTTPTVTISTFNLEENNSQFRLRGNWIESNGGTYNVAAISPGAGSITIQGIDEAGGVSGNTVQPNDEFLDSFSISPQLTALTIGSSQLFTAVGGGATGQIKWSIANGAIGRLSNREGSSTTYTATGAGSQTITAIATGGIFSDSVAITQTAATLTVNPSPPYTVPTGSSQLLIVSGGTGSYSWSLGSGAIGSLSATSGSTVTYTATAIGTQTITITDGVSVLVLSVSQP